MRSNKLATCFTNCVTPIKKETNKISNTWQKFATANKLQYTVDSSFGGQASIYGQYKGYKFQLTEQSTGLEFILSVPNKVPAIKTLDTEALSNYIENVLFSKKLVQHLKGYIRFEDSGKKLLFHPLGIQKDLKHNLNTLQVVVDLLWQLITFYGNVLHLGGKAIEAIQNAATPYKTVPKLVKHLLVDIENDTTSRLKNKKNILCTTCLVACYNHKINLIARVEQVAVSYYGCRRCSQSRHFITKKGPLVAVLDDKMTEKQQENGDKLYVNWLQHKQIFDFDEVLIINTTDKEVERFAIQIGNNTDVVFKAQCSFIPCTIMANCELSKNTIRILGRMLGPIKIRSYAVSKISC